MTSKRVLIAPLDWGLGHATRCIPVITSLIEQGCEVCIAGCGDSLLLLRKEFPHLPHFILPSYRISYSSKVPLSLKLAFRIPRILNSVYQEHKVLDKLISSQNINIVISDNRYGCWSRHVMSILVTHQVNIQVPAHLWFMKTIINYFNHRQILKFNQCWVPDLPDHPLSGKLSVSKYIPIVFIGWLSRLKKSMDRKIIYELTAVISGPEPQRSVFESMVRKELAGYPGRTFMLRGLPGQGEEIFKDGSMEVAPHLSTASFQKILDQSGMVICRSGYSTIMDLAVMGCKAFLVPTPGQSEQEYLASLLQDKGFYGTIPQNHFSLQKVIKNKDIYSGIKTDYLHHTELLRKAIAGIL